MQHIKNPSSHIALSVLKHLEATANKPLRLNLFPLHLISYFHLTFRIKVQFCAINLLQENNDVL